ncbi:GNAT family N-acetyltransferase [Kamptonema cortianum]|nr:GNAT family N-acetyltransferase [Geitlerinema splendidum]MDK3156035.1 GNAT family N-acetyltransferase [Kamptonema cortianum]
MVRYTDKIDGLEASQLAGFFDGWPVQPSPEMHLRMLRGSDYVVLALDGDQVVGFVTAITDGVLSAYIPFLEVLPDYRRQGIGKELIRLILMKLEDYYMIDLTCDPELRSFYVSMGMSAHTAMCLRRKENQAGKTS